MAKTNDKLEKASKGRDSRGRFSPGNLIGPGRPSRERERENLKSFASVVTPEELAKITQAIAAKAKRGDVPAARLLLEYAVGKPTTRIEFTDREEYRVAGQSPAEGMVSMMKRITKKVQEMRAREAALAKEAKSKPKRRKKR